MKDNREQLNIVIVGHVDHGKSTLIGRLLADTNFLPEGKLEAVKSYCEKNAKTFEYAFLLDALKEEQSQGITIDAARCFFKTEKRDYLIIDAPGHFDFVKNMVTGASRAQAGIIVIDASEGIKENTKRHGYLLSILGLNYICVAVNKMDIINYNKKKYDKIVNEYSDFLKSVGVKKADFYSS
ncbi:MAG: GTP-binding protein [Brevinematia bacterium]